jgi:hypothetical protein
MNFNNNSYKFFVYVVISLIFFIYNINTATNSHQVTDLKVIAEGTVKCIKQYNTSQYFNNHIYTLNNPIFLLPDEVRGKDTFLVPDSIISKYQDKRVRVKGSLISIPGRYVNDTAYVVDYDVITIDTVYCIN